MTGSDRREYSWNPRGVNTYEKDCVLETATDMPGLLDCGVGPESTADGNGFNVEAWARGGFF